MRFLDRFRRPAVSPAPRRDFFRRLSGAGLAVAAAGTLGADDAWAAVEARTAANGIVPGTLVDAQGRRLSRAVRPLDPFIGEIILFGGNFQIRGYGLCQGQSLNIEEYTALFAILGTTYGGNGTTTFALPDLRGRSPVGVGQGPGRSNAVLGEVGGQETTTLTQNQMPQHAHSLSGGTVAVSDQPGTTPDPTGAVLAQPASSIPQYVATAPTGALAGGTLGGTTASVGGSQSVDVRDPYLVLNYQIALAGIFPSRD